MNIPRLVRTYQFTTAYLCVAVTLILILLIVDMR